nr:RhuM family protein [Massilia sp. LC238]
MLAYDNSSFKVSPGPACKLDEKATIRNFRIVRQEGARQVTRDVEHYNLDVIISVGYRVKSQQGTRFRIWATTTLRDHLVKGYTVNQRRLTDNRAELEAALELARKAASSQELTTSQGKGLVDVITRYPRTYLLLQQYDEGSLVEPSGTEPGSCLHMKLQSGKLSG